MGIYGDLMVIDWEYPGKLMYCGFIANHSGDTVKHGGINQQQCEYNGSIMGLMISIDRLQYTGNVMCIDSGFCNMTNTWIINPYLTRM